MTERESDVSARWRGRHDAKGLDGKKLNQSLISIELTRCVHIKSSHKMKIVKAQGMGEKEGKSINLNKKLSASQRVRVLSCLNIYETD